MSVKRQITGRKFSGRFTGKSHKHDEMFVWLFLRIERNVVMRELVSLENGLQIWLEPVDTLRTASFGVWIAAGSSHETPQTSGISHFLEHMFFKGSTSRSAQQIAEQMDAIGGQMNAYTTKEYTCFYARTLSEHVAEGFDILSDMLVFPAILPEDTELERGVVLEEIGMSTDDPEDVVGEQLESAVWRDSPYGMPILGRRETVSSFSPHQLKTWLKKHYTGTQTVISICGNYDRDRFLRQAEERFGKIAAGEPRMSPPTTPYRRSCLVTSRPIEQTHLCFCVPGLPSRSEKRWAMSMLNMILGASTSSRLFQRIREELGLVYSIGTDCAPYAGGGLLYVQAAVNPGDARQAAQEIIAVLNRARLGVTQQEFARAREGLKSSLLMSMENSMSRCAYTARGALLGEILSDDELLERVQSVTKEQVDALAYELLDQERLSVSVCGAVEDEAFFRGLV